MPKMITVNTGAGLLFTGPGFYYGSRLTASGAANAQARIRDGTDASATPIVDSLRTATNTSRGRQFTHGVKLSTGLYAELVGAVGRLTVWYEDET